MHAMAQQSAAPKEFTREEVAQVRRPRLASPHPPLPSSFIFPRLAQHPRRPRKSLSSLPSCPERERERARHSWCFATVGHHRRQGLQPHPLQRPPPRRRCRPARRRRECVHFFSPPNIHTTRERARAFSTRLTMRNLPQGVKTSRNGSSACTCTKCWRGLSTSVCRSASSHESSRSCTASYAVKSATSLTLSPPGCPTATTVRTTTRSAALIYRVARSEPADYLPLCVPHRATDACRKPSENS